jgi:outer membrane protein OmpA-like peptidoglycan-associated protein
MRALALAAALSLAVPAAAQEQQDAGPPYEMKVIDLIFTVVDMGGRVEDLRVAETETEVRIDMAADVLFDFDKADLLPKAEETLRKAAEVIREHAGSSAVRITGHTDAKGSDPYNQRLSERRAAAIRSWLEANGLRGTSFTTSGRGAKEPVAPNTKPDGSDDPEGRGRNRRVEIVITKG